MLFLHQNTTRGNHRLQCVLMPISVLVSPAGRSHVGLPQTPRCANKVQPAALQQQPASASSTTTVGDMHYYYYFFFTFVCFAFYTKAPANLPDIVSFRSTQWCAGVSPTPPPPSKGYTRMQRRSCLYASALMWRNRGMLAL